MCRILSYVVQQHFEPTAELPQGTLHPDLQRGKDIIIVSTKQIIKRLWYNITWLTVNV